jgi:peptidyl-dipeptidase A
MRRSVRRRTLSPATALVLLVSVVLVPADAMAQKRRVLKPDPGTAREFIEEAERQLDELAVIAERASWVQSNFITEDTDLLAAATREDLIEATTRYALEARRFDGVAKDPEVERKLRLLALSLPLPAPDNARERGELSRIAAAMESLYGRGRYCPGEGDDGCLTLDDMSRVMSGSRDADRLLEMWRGWHSVSPPLRDMYRRFVELANKGARELGFDDLGVMWRSSYDMPEGEFAIEVERLWKQVAPLYEALHAHVRASLVEEYGPARVPAQGPIPAHLLGNMWAQSWLNIYPLVAPPKQDPGFDLTKILRKKKIDPRGMVRYGERFFTSLGFEPLPDTFWERSLFTRPADREVVCHASAWDIDDLDDLRIKMCIEINEEDFSTIHHELGHNFYQRAYKRQPLLFRDSANAAFHEAVGDTIALSVTPDYLREIGLLDSKADGGGDLGLLMRMALDKVAFLPFGLLVDQWRWMVFSGEVTPERYNAAWWDLRRRYQGVDAPAERSESDFDPGAKYHIPANVSYTRYFLATILQFQFHRALCEAAGYEGPLHRCSIYGNDAAGARLRAMLEMGASRPWPEALEAIAGTRSMDATALLDYFAPLKAWLDEQNRGRPVGY